MKKIAIVLAMMFATSIFAVLLTTTNEQVVVTNATEESIQTDVKEITDEEIKSLLNAFMQVLVQEIDDDYKVIHFATLEELYAAFEPIASREVAEPYIEFYYTEEEDGLYILPTETPPWFLHENPYEKEHISDHIVKITQQNLTDLYGHYTIEIEFTYDNDWKITKITHKE